MRLLDRYVLRNFFEPFLISFFGFIGILLIFDLYDNVPDFIEYHVKAKVVLAFYATQLPAMTLLALPVGLLLALLFSLSKMSRHNEVISMLTAGCSLVRVIFPLICVGVLATGLCFALNVAAAPRADAMKKQMMEEITKGKKKAAAREIIEGHLFRDRLNNRTWFVRKLRPGKPHASGDDKRATAPQLDGVHVSQQDAEGNIVRKWYAARANHDARTGHWVLIKGQIVDFDTHGNITGTDSFKDSAKLVTDWNETPWRIASSQLLAQNLSIAELKEYLRHNHDFPEAMLAPYRTNLADRWAFPWSCVVLVFIAAPLGIAYNRRGMLAAVSGALLLFTATILIRAFLLALGKGARLDPILAAWLPNVIFFAVGLWLLWMRSTNRDLKFAFWR